MWASYLLLRNIELVVAYIRWPVPGGPYLTAMSLWVLTGADKRLYLILSGIPQTLDIVCWGKEKDTSYTWNIRRKLAGQL